MIDFEESNISFKNVNIYSEDILPQLQKAIYDDLNLIGTGSAGRGIVGSDEFMERLEEEPADMSIKELVQLSNAQLSNVVIDWPWGIHIFARGQNERKVGEL